LIIQDEAHAGPTKGGQADKFINDEYIRNAKNVVTLFVSATPFNLLIRQSQIPVENEIKWDGSSGNTTYYGMTEYCKNSVVGKDPLNKEYEGCIQKDTVFEEKYNAVKGKGAWQNANMFHVLRDEYVEAIAQTQGKTTGKAAPSKWTKLMVDDLVKRRSDGSGIMILLRTGPNGKKEGPRLFRHLTNTRDALGLQDRFAVCMDIQTKNKGNSGLFNLVKQQDPTFVARKRNFLEELGVPKTNEDKWQKVKGGYEPKIETYSDLHDLPCILILCEKGRMGDTFPASLRYYDLRLRYGSTCGNRASAEQDLGRAFRYHDVSSRCPLPLILVGSACHRKILGAQRNGRIGLLRENPDPYLKQVNKSAIQKPNESEGTAKSEWPFPEKEFDTEAYRLNWDAKKPTKKDKAHFDYERTAATGKDNPRRLLLMGKPQIGKTGVCLHTIKLLWDALGCVKSQPEISEIDPGPLPAPIPPPPPDPANRGLYPEFDVMVNQPVDGDPMNCTHKKPCTKCAPRPGKYGDPKVEELWQHYVGTSYNDQTKVEIPKRPPLQCESCDLCSDAITEAPGSVGDRVVARDKGGKWKLGEQFYYFESTTRYSLSYQPGIITQVSPLMIKAENRYCDKVKEETVVSYGTAKEWFEVRGGYTHISIRVLLLLMRIWCAVCRDKTAMETTTATKSPEITAAANPPSKANVPTKKTQRVPSDQQKGPTAESTPSHASSADALEVQPESGEEVVKSRFMMLRGPEEPSGAEVPESKKQKTSRSRPYAIDFGDGNKGTLHLQSAAGDRPKLKAFGELNDGKTVAFPIFMPSSG
jgi:hypothetical protein